MLLTVLHYHRNATHLMPELHFCLFMKAWYHLTMLPDFNPTDLKQTGQNSGSEVSVT